MRLLIKNLRPLVLLAVVLLVTLSLILLRNKPRQQQILSFNPPDCFLPCVLGIVPGKTDFYSAFQVLASTSVAHGSHTYGSDFELKAANSGTFDIVVRPTDPRAGHYVSQLFLYTLYPNKFATLGDMLNAGYRPVRVFRSRINGPGGISLLIVFGEDQTIAADVEGFESVNAESPIRYIHVFAREDQGSPLEDVLMIEHWDYEIDWLGYAPIDAYLNQAPQDLQSFLAPQHRKRN
jgi:hypothetical protein